MIRASDIEEMKNIDIRKVDPATLVDIKTVKVNTDLSVEERKKDFIRQVKNPYCFRCGNIVIKISFADTTATLEERLEKYFKSL
ncbi:DUF6870 family protein [Oceanirhabdus seepicola]|uniref:DUF6870 domain-containing protein n=1 Tax=Oceanirhabdus seepicola TaxID=2828781 RepID=A0A9J6NWF6_9CLOT|nr:hypothetical protein [Oceanirhabdus seepicola]MCM1988842.1 hypothetical protein [Oceanirhabdus seepicola]